MCRTNLIYKIYDQIEEIFGATGNKEENMIYECNINMYYAHL